jgi:hypothetical protein
MKREQRENPGDMKPNYLHLDMKGIIPLFPRILDWLEWFAACGFTGIVWEYEDRLAWESWPDTFRPGYSNAQWRRIWERCRELDLEIIPLIQTHGHLEWLLKFDRYAAWRENGCWNEICPRNPEAVNAIQAWLGEVRKLHPDSRYIHIGGDETWNLASCPTCGEVAGSVADGKLDLYLNHLRTMAETVLRLGARPVVWGDMFWREGKPELAARLPPETILIDWQYAGAGPWPTTAKLAATGLEVWGASAVSASYDQTQLLAPIAPSITNVQGWRRLADEGAVNAVIHTTWGRSRSLLPPYGPWERTLPGFLAAGSSGLWSQSPLQPYAAKLDAALKSPDDRLPDLIGELDGLRLPDPFDQAALDWWRLGLRHLPLRNAIVNRCMNFNLLEASHRFLKAEPDYVNHFRRGAQVVRSQMDAFFNDVSAYFIERQLSDAEEFVHGRREALDAMLRQDWADSIIPHVPPRTAR